MIARWPNIRFANMNELMNFYLTRRLTHRKMELLHLQHPKMISFRFCHPLELVKTCVLPQKRTTYFLPALQKVQFTKRAPPKSCSLLARVRLGTLKTTYFRFCSFDVAYKYMIALKLLKYEPSRKLRTK